MNSQLQTIVRVVSQVKGNDPLYLHQPVIFRYSPHVPPVEVHGLCVSPAGPLYLMDLNGEWHQLEANDLRADEVTAAVYQRITKDFKDLVKAKEVPV